MKKVLLVFSIFLTMFLIYTVRNTKVVEPVSLKENVFFNLDDYNVFYLNLEEDNISTLNITDFILNDTVIISIVPYINPIYKDKIGNLKYKFENISLKKNMNKFTSFYIDSINKIGINDDLNYIKVNGIKINEIELYSKGSDIVNIIYNHRKIKYKNFLNEKYNYLEF